MPAHAGVMRRDRSLGLPLAVIISVGFHVTAGAVALLWPREPELKPQITLDLVDESETSDKTAKAEEKPAEEKPAEEPPPEQQAAQRLLEELREKEKKPEPERAKPEPEKLAKVEPIKVPPEREKKPVDLRIVPLPPPPPEKAPPPPKREPPKEEKKAEKKPEPPKPVPLPPELRRMKMVDQDHDKNEPENKEAELLAQKNRRVQEQTRARDTNLERQARGERQGSAPSERDDEQVGGPKEKIAELAEERSHRERKAPPVTPHADEQVLEQRDPKPKNLLSMRDLPRRTHEASRGAEEMLVQAPDGVLRGREKAKAETSLTRREQQARSAGRGQQLKLALTGHDYDKVVGRDEQEKVRRLAQREQSHHKGRWEKKWGAIKSSLENFIPEVRPGNQTALNTRAMPFASYIARMHRNIHKLWGFGVLEDWDLKSSSSPLNDMSRWTMLEIVLHGDGTIDKVTVARPSGYLPFDVAAMDVVLSSAPYPDPPAEIKSANGKIYLHWRFHRDSRQCATFGVDPYILTTPPKGPADKPALPTDAEEVARPGAPERGLPTPGAPQKGPRALRRPVALTDHTYRGPAPEVRHEGHGHEHEEPDPEAARRAATRVARADDPAARSAGEAWLRGYVRGDVEALVAQSRLPFRSGEKFVARKPSELLKLYRTLLDEAPAKRTDARLEILSAAGLRGKLGALPRGLDDGAGMLFGVARAGSDLFVLVLGQEGVGHWKVAGLAR